MDIRTNAVEEKARACRVLSMLVYDLHAAMLPWLPQIMQTILPILNTYSFEDMQYSALSIMPELLVAFADSITTNEGIASYREQFLTIINTLLVFIMDAELKDFLPALQTLDICLEKSALHINGQIIEILDASEVSHIIEVLYKTLLSSFERRAVRSAEMEESDWDEEGVEEYHEIEHQENEAHLHIAKNIGTLLQNHAAITLPALQEICLDTFLECSDQYRTGGDRLVGLYVMAKIIEFCGKDAFPFYGKFIPFFLRELHASDAVIRQVVAIALSKAVEVGKELVCEIVPRCVKEVESTLEDPVSRESCYKQSNAAGVVLLGKLCFHLGTYLIMLPDHLKFWLNSLPLKDFQEENEICIALLCGMLERGEQAMMGEGSQNIPLILRILSTCMFEVREIELQNRMLKLIKTIEMQSSPDLMNAIWEMLGMEKSELLKQKLAGIQLLM